MDHNPYQTPQAESALEAHSRKDLVYAGFWVRVVASFIDSILILVITVPLIIAIYGDSMLGSDQMIYGVWHFLISWVFPVVAVIMFWVYRSATPGKMVLRLKIVDAESGDKPSTAQFIGRYFAYIVSTLPLFLGFLWVAFDSRKQGWHDKLAGTAVIRD